MDGACHYRSAYLSSLYSPDLSPLITWWAGLVPNREKLSSTRQHVLKEYVASFLASSSSFLHPLSTAAHPHTVLQLAFFRNEASL